MHKFALTFAAALCIAAPAAASEESDVMAPISAFMDAIGKGDLPAAAAAHVADPTILDEFPAHHWSGPGSFAAWGGDYGKDAAANGVTEGKLTAGTPKHLTISGDHAYVVVPTDYTFKKKGTSVVEHGTIVYALDKTASGWKIASWAFSW